MRLHSTLTVSALAAGIAMSILTSCAEPASTPVNPPLADSSSVSTSGTMKLDGEIISVPSPAELSLLVRESKVPFRPELLNKLDKRSSYTDQVWQAMNLGVYGADLAYIANFEDGQMNHDYFDAVGKLASELQVIENVDRNLVTRLTNNIANRDSLIALNAQFFRAGDSYLKKAQRADLAGLVLIGGWVEALYISSEHALDNELVRKRLAEQKYASESIVRLLDKYNDPNLEGIRTELKEVREVFADLEANYQYQKPIHDTRQKTTYLRSKSSIAMSNEDLDELRAHLSTLRTLITR